jgi:hypothetical protein
VSDHDENTWTPVERQNVEAAEANKREEDGSLVVENRQLRQDLVKSSARIARLEAALQLIAGYVEPADDDNRFDIQIARDALS